MKIAVLFQKIPMIINLNPGILIQLAHVTVLEEGHGEVLVLINK